MSADRIHRPCASTALMIGGVLAALLAAGASGCAAAPVERAYLTIASGQYHEAFDAAGEAARAHGLVPALRDRRAGIIETEPAIAGSLLEPWDRATRTVEQAAASTLSFQRRRARFEFQPAGFSAIAVQRSEVGGQPTDSGTMISDLGTPTADLTEIDPHGELELRVWVYSERAHIPGIRRSNWSRRMTTRMDVIEPETGVALRPMWTVVTRDRALEEHLLGQVHRMLAR